MAGRISPRSIEQQDTWPVGHRSLAGEPSRDGLASLRDLRPIAAGGVSDEEARRRLAYRAGVRPDADPGDTVVVVECQSQCHAAAAGGRAGGADKGQRIIPRETGKLYGGGKDFGRIKPAIRRHYGCVLV